MSARLQGKPFKATLEYISPKGVVDQGTIKFTIRAAVALDKELFLRSNYSANADIVLDKREDALAVNEGNLIIEGDKEHSSKWRPRRSSSRSARSRPGYRMASTSKWSPG